MTGLCWGCKRLKELVHVDPLARRFCANCSGIEAMGASERAGRYFLSVTVPYESGDRVECRLAGERYDGTGTITTVSMDLKDGGTPVMPIFHVAFDPTDRRDKPDGWYCERDLTRVDEKVS